MEKQLKSNWKQSLVYTLFLVLFSFALIAYSSNHLKLHLNISYLLSYILFISFGVFTLFMGFKNKKYGYASFERIAQISSILILGPIHAAITQGIAMMIFGIYRSKKRKITPKVALISVLNNTGLIMIMIIISGLAFYHLGGSIPLIQINLKQFLLLLLLFAMMQSINVIGMLIIMKLAKVKLKNPFGFFTTSIEIAATLSGILMALILNNMDYITNALFLVVLLISVYYVNQFARLSTKLNKIVEFRTQSLLEKSKQLEFEANHDSLTGLANRRFINKQIIEHLQDQQEQSKPLFVAYADVDNFKQINDDYSHDVGDEVLVKIGEIMQHFSSQKLIMSRFGGEEFLFLFIGQDLDSVNKTCETIINKIRTMDLSHLGIKKNITISIGIAKANQHSVHKNLIHVADTNLYKAKQNGKDTIVFSS